MNQFVQATKLESRLKNFDFKDFLWHRQVKRDVNLSIERLKGMIYRIAVTIYQ
ncbi:MAG: hypothetical protein RCG16_08640 [Rickettsia hoogstraalii]